MKRLSLKLMIALLTFSAGVAFTSVWLAHYHSTTIKRENQLLSEWQAKEIIQNSEAFNYPKEALLLLSTAYYPTIQNTDEPLYGILEEMGMIEIIQIRKHSFKVQLTEKGKEQNWPCGDNDWAHLPEARLVPIAGRALSAINSIRSLDKETAEVQFVWHWKANELGEKLKTDTSSHVCVIEIKRYGSSWCIAHEDASKRLGASEGQP